MKKRIAVIGCIVVATIMGIVVAFGDQLGWRSQVLLLKTSGELDFLSWSETVLWLLPDSPVYVSNLLDGRNPHTALTTEGIGDEHILVGRKLFREHCSGCHGVAGEGGTAGPTLANDLTRRSDWLLYQVLKTGIPGTSMQPQKLEANEAWNVVAYVRTLAADVERVDADGLEAVFQGPSYDRIVNRAGEMDNWLTYSGGLFGQRHSNLSDVNRSNVSSLVLKWVYQSATSYNRVQASPIVVDGLMIITEPPGRVTALNAVTGKVLWEFEREIPNDLMLCCGVVNRGVAVLNDLVYVATIDAHLIALDLGSGRKRWETQIADHTQGYSVTSAPLVIGNKVVTGVAGGETATRGLIVAYSASEGKEVWRFDTIPEPGETGSETWRNALWKIGGAATWMTGSYDPDLDLLYWGTSHTVQEPDAADRSSAKKLYGSSLVALRGSTGELAWHFQFTPDDLHGFDAAQVPVLVDLPSENGPERVLLTANRNGFFYVLDRTYGTYITGTPFTKVTWAKGLDDTGSPIADRDFDPSVDGTLSWPSHGGGTNWWPPAYIPSTQTLCFPAVDGPSVFYVEDIEHIKGRPYVPVVGHQPVNKPWDRSIRCVDARTGMVRWNHRLESKVSDRGALVMGGVLHTSGELVFGSDRHFLFALNDQTGEELWRVNGGGNIVSPPMTYRVEGVQYVAVTAGKALLVFGLPEKSNLAE